MKAFCWVWFSCFWLVLAACAPASAPSSVPDLTAAPTAAVVTPVRASTSPTALAGPASTSLPPPSAPSATPIPSPAPQVTPRPGALRLQFWHLFGLQQAVALQRLVDRFNAANPAIYVTPVNQGTNYDQLSQKLRTALAAGVLPEVTIGTPGDLTDYFQAGVLTPLDEYIAHPQTGLAPDLRADMDPTLFFDVFQGRTIGLSFARSEQVLYYNLDLLNALGMVHPPETWDEFDRACAALVSRPGFNCYAFLPNASTFAGWVWSRGGEYASPDEKEARFDNPAGREALEWLKKVAVQGWAYRPAGQFGDQTDFAKGQVLFTFGSTTGLPFYQDAIRTSGKSIRWGIAPFPRGSGGRNVVPILGPSAGIFVSTPEKQQASWLFVRFLLTESAQQDWVQATTYFPARRSLYAPLLALTPEAVRASDPNFAAILPQYQQAIRLLPLGRREPTSPTWRQASRTIIPNLLTTVFTAKSGPDFASTEPAAAAREGVERVNRSIQEYGK